MNDRGAQRVRTAGGWTRLADGARSAEDEALANIERKQRDKKRIPGHVDRNAGRIMRYLETWPTRVEASLMGSDEPYKHKARGSSRVPTPDGGLRFMFEEGLGVAAGDDSEQALAYLRSSLRDLERGSTRAEGTTLRGILLELWRDPGAAARWEAASARGDSEEDEAMHRAFRKLSLLLAQVLDAKFPGAEVTVGTEEERERAATQRAYNVERRAGKEYALRTIGEAILRYKERTGCGTEEAVRRFREKLKGDDEQDQSRARCYEALAFVRGEDEDLRS